MGKRKDGLDDRVTLIEAMLAVAYADGDFGDAERKRTRQLVRFLRLGGDAADYVAQLFEATSPPAMPDASELPDHDTCRYIFQQALIMAYEDGHVDASEKERLNSLATLFSLTEEEVTQAWTSAEALGS